MKKRGKDCFVYFIRQGQRGPIKIGHATNVGKRLLALQAANPQPLHLLGCFPGSPAMESTLHCDFFRDHLRGEWFRPTKRLLSLIEAWLETPALAAAYWTDRVPTALIREEEAAWARQAAAAEKRRAELWGTRAVQ